MATSVWITLSVFASAAFLFQVITCCRINGDTKLIKYLNTDCTDCICSVNHQTSSPTTSRHHLLIRVVVYVITSCFVLYRWCSVQTILRDGFLFSYLQESNIKGFFYLTKHLTDKVHLITCPVSVTTYTACYDWGTFCTFRLCYVAAVAFIGLPSWYNPV